MEYGAKEDELGTRCLRTSMCIAITRVLEQIRFKTLRTVETNVKHGKRKKQRHVFLFPCGRQFTEKPTATDPMGKDCSLAVVAVLLHTDISVWSSWFASFLHNKDLLCSHILTFKTFRILRRKTAPLYSIHTCIERSWEINTYVRNLIVVPWPLSRRKSENETNSNKTRCDGPVTIYALCNTTGAISFPMSPFWGILAICKLRTCAVTSNLHF